jgi:DNA-binding MarR family transcriptional regulator
MGQKTNTGDKELIKKTSELFEIMSVYVNRFSVYYNPEMYNRRYTTLLILSRKQPCTLKSLSAMLHVTPSTQSLLIQELVDLGLVSRIADDLDRRKVLLTLTEKGAASAKKYYNEVQKKFYNEFKSINSGELIKFMDAVNIISSILVSIKPEIA